MNKAELIDEVAKVTCSKKEAGEAVLSPISNLNSSFI